MIRFQHALLSLGMIAALNTFGVVQAQIFYRQSGPTRVIPQNVPIYNSNTRVYANNGVQYQSFRPSYGQSTVYSNGYVVQPNGSYNSSTQYYSAPNYRAPIYSSPTPTYYAQPTTPYYYDTNGNRVYSSNQAYSGNQVYSSQPSAVYSSNYGTGFYNNPQQANNANIGATIGNAIGGSQGAQVGAAIGSAIRP